MHFGGKTTGFVRIIFGKRNDEICINQQTAGCKKREELLINSCQRFLSTEVMQSLKGVSGIYRGQPFHPVQGLQICIFDPDMRVSGATKPCLRMPGEFRINIDADKRMDSI